MMWRRARGDEENVIRDGEERPEDVVEEENGPEMFGAGQYETILEKMRAERLENGVVLWRSETRRCQHQTRDFPW